MFSEPIVKYFDVVEHMLAKFIGPCEDAVTYRAGFEAAVEGFHRGIVVTVPLGTHAGFQSEMA